MQGTQGQFSPLVVVLPRRPGPGLLLGLRREHSEEHRYVEGPSDGSQAVTRLSGHIVEMWRFPPDDTSQSDDRVVLAFRAYLARGLR